MPLDADLSAAPPLTELTELTEHARPVLQAALLESRQRWQDLVALGSDLAFEIGVDGCVSFITPGVVLGWRAAELVGAPVDHVLATAEDARLFLPATRSSGRAWLRRADGGTACMALVCRPLLDERGQPAGWRGVGRDITEQARGEAAMAAALRRAETMDHILRQTRHEVLAPRMMAAALNALTAALGADGAALLDPSGEMSTRHHVGAALPLPGSGHRLLSCVTDGRRGVGPTLVLWRSPDGRPWDAEERQLADSAAAIVRMILDHEAMQVEMGRQARTDPLTGLLNRRAFLEELDRRVERLSRDGLPGTLIYVDLDRFKSINDAWGHEVGDVALCLVGAALRNATRPTDLVARLGGDEFAMWLDGADELTAAERAEALRLDRCHALVVETTEGSVKLSLSTGIACRPAGSDEDIGALVNRADLAMYQVKQAGRGHWRVAPAPQTRVTGPAPDDA